MKSWILSMLRITTRPFKVGYEAIALCFGWCLRFVVFTPRHRLNHELCQLYWLTLWGVQQLPVVHTCLHWELVGAGGQTEGLGVLQAHWHRVLGTSCSVLHYCRLQTLYFMITSHYLVKLNIESSNKLFIYYNSVRESNDKWIQLWMNKYKMYFVTGRLGKYYLQCRMAGWVSQGTADTCPQSRGYLSWDWWQLPHAQ